MAGAANNVYLVHCTVTAILLHHHDNISTPRATVKKTNFKSFCRSSKIETMNTKSPEDLSKACSVVEELMFLHPKGKQSLGFFPDRLVIQTSKQQMVILSSDVTNIVVCAYDLKVLYTEKW